MDWIKLVSQSQLAMNKSDLPQPNLIDLRKKILAQINKQQEPTPKQKYDQAIYNRTWNPETMQAERLREFQSIVNEAFPKTRKKK